MERLSSALSSLFVIIVSLSVLLFTPFPGQSSFGEERSEQDIKKFLAEFTPIPGGNLNVWQEVPKEEWISRLQFLIDQGRSNYERIRTWSGTYDLHKTYRLLPPKEHGNVHTEEDAEYVSMHELYSFFCDFVENKSYMDNRRLEVEYRNPNGKLLELPKVQPVSNISAILTSKEAILYQYGEGSDQIRPELKGEYEGRIGKICTVKSPEDAIGVDIGSRCTLFDPRLFFLDSLRDFRPSWANLENALLPWLRGKGTEKYKAKAENGISFWEARIGSSVWYRLVYKDDELKIRNEYVYNSDSNYNPVYVAGFRDGKPSDERYINYDKIDGVYIPSKWASVTDSDGEGRKICLFFRLNDCQLNKPIPEKQFSMEALALDEDVVVMNNINSTTYEYTPENGLSPISKYGSDERIIPTEPLWRSPLRLTAFAIGIVLLIGGVFFKIKIRRKSA